MAVEAVPEPAFWTDTRSMLTQAAPHAGSTAGAAQGSTAAAAGPAGGGAAAGGLAGLQQALLATVVESMDVHKAEATVPEDKVAIFGMIEESLGLARFNDEIRARLLGMVQELLLMVGNRVCTGHGLGTGEVGWRHGVGG